jgi:GGDEF domain-containing protein
MSTHNPPMHLRLVSGHVGARPLPLTERQAHRRTALKRGVAGVLDRHELFDTCERVGEVAPTAPLSFLVVTIDGLATLSHDERTLTMRLVSGRVRALTRALDAVGRMGDAALGVLLQGTGATAAGAVAARMSYHVSQALHVVDAELGVRVSAATGTGANWATLPIAATPSLPDCG